MNPAAALAIIGLLIVLIGAMVLVLVMVIQWAGAERLAWAEERRMLVDRVIAGSVGEVIALDRVAAQGDRSPRESTPRPEIEGLS